MSRRRGAHALVRALRAAGGEAEQVGARVRVTLPPGIPPDDRPLLRWLVRQLVTNEPFDKASDPSARRRSGRRGRT
jgi:hypothetical protein